MSVLAWQMLPAWDSGAPVWSFRMTSDPVEEHHVQCLAFELTRWLISHPLDLGVVAGGMKRRKEKSEAQRIADRTRAWHAYNFFWHLTKVAKQQIDR